MARPVTTNPPDQTATLRHLKVLAVVLILSNICLGVLSFYLLRTIDRQYTSLIQQSVHVLSDLQTQTAVTVEAMRATNLALFNVPPAERSGVTGRARTALERERGSRTDLLKAEWLAPDAKERLEFRQSGEEFDRAAVAMVGFLSEGDLTEANRLREESLRPAFERFLTATTKAADVLYAESVRMNDELTARTGNLSAIVLGLASGPVALLLALLLLTAIFVLVLMVLFRGREMGDMP